MKKIFLILPTFIVTTVKVLVFIINYSNKQKYFKPTIKRMLLHWGYDKTKVTI